MLIDTHCHIHSADFPLDRRAAIADAKSAGVEKLICVGTDEQDSQLAVDFVAVHDSCWAAVGLHPHDAKSFDRNTTTLPDLAIKPGAVAIGECGFDYWYEHSQRAAQEAVFRFQIELALQHDLPMIFHIRGSRTDPTDAFNDFFRVFDEYTDQGHKIHGVVHSFSAGQRELTGVISRGLYVGLNGIMTFSKDERQLEAAKAVPLGKMVLETDAPFLTPSPKRGTVNEPKHLGLTAEFLAQLRGESITRLSDATMANASQLFKI